MVLLWHNTQKNTSISAGSEDGNLIIALNNLFMFTFSHVVCIHSVVVQHYMYVTIKHCRMVRRRIFVLFLSVYISSDFVEYFFHLVFNDNYYICGIPYIALVLLVLNHGYTGHFTEYLQLLLYHH